MADGRGGSVAGWKGKFGWLEGEVWLMGEGEVWLAGKQGIVISQERGNNPHCFRLFNVGQEEGL